MKTFDPSWKTIALLFLVLNATGWWYAASRASRPDDLPPEKAAEKAAAAALPAVPPPPPPVQPAPPAPVVSPISLDDISVRINAFDAPSILLDFDADFDPEALEKGITIRPECEFHVSKRYTYWDDEFAINGDFVPGTEYTVTLSAGVPVKSKNRAVLTDIVREVEIPNRPVGVSFPDSGRYLAPNADSAIFRLKTVNAPSVDLYARRLRDNNLFPFLRDDDYSEFASANALAGGPAVTATIDTAAPINEIRETDVDLRSILPKGKTAFGTYAIHGLATSGERSFRDMRLVVLSDIGLSVRLGTDNRALAWTTALSTGRPLGDVTVTLVSRSNHVLAKGVTGPDGVVVLDCVPDEADSPLAHDDVPFFVTAALGDDMTFVCLDDRSYNATPRDRRPAGTREPGKDVAYEAFVFAPRGIFRPGETLPVKAVLRDLKGNAPAPFPVTLELVRPDGVVVASRTMGLSEAGTVEASFDISPVWPTGGYFVRAVLPGDDKELGFVVIAVEDIVPPQIKVALDGLPERTLLTGEKTSADVSGDFLFGAPAAGLPCGVRYTLRAESFAPKGWEDYRFGDAARPSSFTRSGAIWNGVLDDQGKIHVVFSVPSVDPPAAALRLDLVATVSQAGGRPVVASTTRSVTHAPFYIGLRPATDGSVTVAVSNEVRVALVAPDGEAYTNAAPVLSASIEEVTRSWHWRRNSDGDWDYSLDTHTTHVADLPPLEPQDGVASLAAAFPHPGTFRLRVRDAAGSASSTLDFDVIPVGATWAHTGVENPAVVSVVPDSATVAPGEEVALTVKSPVSGEGMLFIEGAGGQWRHIPLSLSNTAARVTFPATEDDVPSLRATVVVLRPASPETRTAAAKALSVHRAIGSSLVTVVPPGRALAVEIGAPTEILPQSPLSLSATVLSGEAPVAGAEVTFAAVDEGLCSLTDYRTPDPLAWLNAPRWIAVRHFDLFSRLLPVYAGGDLLGTSHIGGDDELANRLSPFGAGRRFRPVSLWQGTVLTDAEGHASATFDVPEFSGRLRLMAIAVTTNQCGSAEDGVFIRRPVTVLPTFPRFLAPGDVFDATVEVFNTASNALDAVVEIVPPQGSPVSREISLDSGARTNFIERLAAPATLGATSYRVRATAKGSTDPFYEEEVEMPVRPAAAYFTERRSGLLRPGESIDLGSGGDTVFDPDVSLLCSRRPEAQLSGALDYLIRYPYGCLEQKTSTVFPLLYLEELAGASRPDVFTNGTVRGYVEAGIEGILSLQRPNGGFALWPDNWDVYTWGSLYATHFLLEAKKAGYAVPEKPLRKAVDFVVGCLTRIEGVSDEGSLCLRAYATQVAVLGGRTSVARPWMDRLLEKRADLPLAARAHVASALLSAGRPRDAATVMGDDGLLPAPDDDSREFGGTLRSPARDAALLLLAQCDLDPSAPLATKLVELLLARRTEVGRWFTTQENAMAILALGKYYRAVFSASDDAVHSASVTLPGSSGPVATSLVEPFRWKGHDGHVSVANDGSVPFYYDLSSTGVPVVPPSDSVSDGLEVRREYRDPETGAVIEPDGDGIYRLSFGQSVIVILTLRPTDHLEQVVITDLLPAGLEIDNPAVMRDSTGVPAWLTELFKQTDFSGWIQSADIRDDRLLLFTGWLRTRPYVYVYTARAVTPGSYVLPSVTAEAMYDPRIRARTAPAHMEVSAK